MISSITTKASAGALALGGALLLFTPDVLLPVLVPGFPAAGVWLGQLLGAAWLALAAMNWAHRHLVLGGIYARNVVYANLVVHTISALSLARALAGGVAPHAVWPMCAGFAALTVVYGALLFRGPFDAPRPTSG